MDGYLIYKDTSTEPIVGDVDADSIGQFTGRFDRNGYKIFEGDIVQGKIANREYGQNKIIDVIGNVTYIDGESSFMVMTKLGYYKLTEVYGCKIVGNVYDNPELIEKE